MQQSELAGKRIARETSEAVFPHESGVTSELISVSMMDMMMVVA